MDADIIKNNQLSSFLEDSLAKSIISTNKKSRRYKNKNFEVLKSILLGEITGSLYQYLGLYSGRQATDASRFVKSCYWGINRFENGDLKSIECVPKKKGEDNTWGGESNWIEKLSNFVNIVTDRLDMDALSFQSRSENIEEFNISLVPAKEKQHQPDFSIPNLDFGALSSIQFQ